MGFPDFIVACGFFVFICGIIIRFNLQPLCHTFFEKPLISCCATVFVSPHQHRARRIRIFSFEKIRIKLIKCNMISKRQPFSNDFRLISSTAFYILSGCIQPLIVSLLKEAGLADPRCQLSMTFYYAMPALFIFPLLLMDQKESWPKRCTTFKAAG